MLSCRCTASVNAFKDAALQNLGVESGNRVGDLRELDSRLRGGACLNIIWSSVCSRARTSPGDSPARGRLLSRAGSGVLQHESCGASWQSCRQRSQARPSTYGMPSKGAAPDARPAVSHTEYASFCYRKGAKFAPPFDFEYCILYSAQKSPALSRAAPPPLPRLPLLERRPGAGSGLSGDRPGPWKG